MHKSKLREFEVCPVCECSLLPSLPREKECPQCHSDLEVHRLLTDINLGDHNMPHEKTKFRAIPVILSVQTAILAISITTFAYYFIQTENQFRNLDHQITSLKQVVKLERKSSNPSEARVSDKNMLTPMLQQLLTLYQQERQESFTLGQKLVKLRKKLVALDQELALSTKSNKQAPVGITISQAETPS